jgi:hypothetical protein
VSAKKKSSPARLQESTVKGIRLKPCATDYATFVRVTSQVLGTTGPAAHKTKPNELVLRLANMGS